MAMKWTLPQNKSIVASKDLSHCKAEFWNGPN